MAEPQRIEAEKLLADFVKWLASLSTLILGGAGFSLNQKVSGWLVWIFVAGMLLQILSICAAGLAFISVIGMVRERDLSGKEHGEMTNQMIACVYWQMATFAAGLVSFLVLVISIAITGSL